MKNFKKFLMNSIIGDYKLLLTYPLDAPNIKKAKIEPVKSHFEKNFTGYVLNNIVLNQKS